MRKTQTQKNKRILSIFFVLACLVLIALSAHLRMNGVQENGLRGSDTYEYYEIARLWTEGRHQLVADLSKQTHYYRPFFYLLSSWSLELFGKTDWALRMMNGLFETANLLIVLLISGLLFRSVVYAFISGLAYSSCISTITASQTELPHTPSTTFVLLMFYFLLKFIDQPEKRHWLPLSGFMGGLAAHLHGSTTFWGPSAVSLLATWAFWGQPKAFRYNFRKFVKVAFVFTTAFFLPYLLFMSFVGFEEALYALKSESRIRTSGPLNPLSLFWTYSSEGIEYGLSPHWKLLYWISSFYLLVFLVLRKIENLRNFAPFLLLNFCLLCFAIVFQNVFYVRIFLPFNAFIVLTVLVAFHDFYHRAIDPLFSKPQIRSLAMGLFSTALILGSSLLMNSTFKHHKREILDKYNGLVKGGPRTVFDFLGDKVNSENRILIAPYLQYYKRKQYRSFVYFGTNASYLMDCKSTDLLHLVEKEKIKYIVIGNDIDFRITKKPWFQDRLGLCTGQNFQTFDHQKDLNTIEDFLRNMKARLLVEDKTFGKLYEI